MFQCFLYSSAHTLIHLAFKYVLVHDYQVHQHSDKVKMHC